MSLALVPENLDGLESLSSDCLQKLQVSQFHHDETYHREIARLPVQRRLTHMTLHFAKYCGRLYGDDIDEQQTIADIFAIALSSANILGLSLADMPIARMQHSKKNDYVRALVSATGKMSAACEKLDHLEDFPFRVVLRESVTAIVIATLAYAAEQGWNLELLITNRLESVRAKAFLPGRIS